jgi:hypothetical protein
LDLKYNAAQQSAGYRDVCVLLSLVEGPATAVGNSSISRINAAGGASEAECVVSTAADEYICELQLQLTPFYSVKSDEGHRRYVEYRNSIAE